MSFIIVNPTDKPIQLGGVSLPPKTPYEVQSLDNIQGWADAVASKSLTIVDATLTSKERKELADILAPHYHTGDPVIDG